MFCPSPHTHQLEFQDNLYACSPPPENKILWTKTGEWHAFTQNEVKRILPLNWDNKPYTFRLNRRDQNRYEVPQDGFDIPPKTRFNFFVSRPVDLELQYRVTYPPNAVYHYDAQNRRTLRVHRDSPGMPSGFLMKNETFVTNTLNLPTYELKELMNNFESAYHP